MLTGLRSHAAGFGHVKEDARQANSAITVASCNAFPFGFEANSPYCKIYLIFVKVSKYVTGLTKIEGNCTLQFYVHYCS